MGVTLLKLLPIVCLFVLLCLYVYLCPCFDLKRFNSIAFHPLRSHEGDSHSLSLNGMKIEDVYFSSKNGCRLNGLFISHPASARVVLFNHGNAGNLTHRASKLAGLLSLGLSVFIYDYQGYGKSEGIPSLSGVIEDAEAAFDYLRKERDYASEQIIIYGESIGAAVAGRLSKLRSCAALILESPFISLEYLAKELLPILNVYPSFLFPSPHLDNLDIVKTEHPPLLIIAGEKDSLVPCTHGKQLFKQALEPKTLALLPNNGHNDICILDTEGYSACLDKFLKEYELIQ